LTYCLRGNEPAETMLSGFRTVSSRAHYAPVNKRITVFRDRFRCIFAYPARRRITASHTVRPVCSFEQQYAGPIKLVRKYW
jgi:hypothetical protein